MSSPLVQPPSAGTDLPQSATLSSMREVAQSRRVPTVPEPYSFKPNDEDLYLKDSATGLSIPNVQLLKDHFINEGRLKEEQALWILETASSLMRQEPNMLIVDGPVTGCLWRHSRSILRPGEDTGIRRRSGK
ncbi:hypothetical protein NLI96_g2143 [Meripilus lineatus]|uniref:Uncharacterized protein n=1 Tax=Meripilus lineatus TaxID=2056292 RepID=A0AAD5VBE4_9APHY|nr:hypothetical protein NLI96_g2143 [Physisporinus lineatus]